MKVLTDDSPMPFGKYKGICMKDVPASYLHYLWTDGLIADKFSNVAKYIGENLETLKLKYTDEEWLD